ncbi:hypothetical protein CVT24_006343 [Panaeolus cyanescens]|uniref:Retrovirus-related Pol polyprotein from transposon TNT 1-94-like beta-barrel domain-containing protein n=1 Tax=Panaeolus cyanescens TaxID=181874 RepID=A0A409YEA9_9AGAR|nr:hypothetical protein CVT24_006343 [Panaeolus cyanescens]
MPQPQRTRKHSANPYIISTTSPEHISNVESDFVSIRSIDPNEVSLSTPFGDRLIAQGRGDIKLTLANGKTLLLKDALYVPTLTTPLFSFARITKDLGAAGLQTTATGSIILDANGQPLATATLHPKYNLPALDLNNAVDIPLPDPSDPPVAYCFSVF